MTAHYAARSNEDKYVTYAKRAAKCGWRVKPFDEWLRDLEYYKSQYVREVGVRKPRSAGYKCCLGCGDRFYSTHKTNRSCKPCNGRS